MKTILFLCVLVLASCTPTTLWKYDLEVINPGTRSEGKRGHLSYNEKQIEYIDSRLLTPLGIFEYRQGEMPWEDIGWFKIGPQTSHGESANLIDLNIWVDPRKIDKYYVKNKNNESKKH